MAVGILVLLIAFMSSSTFVSASSKEFSFTDYYTDIPYSVIASKVNVSIQSDSFQAIVPIDTPVLSACVSEGIIYFLTYIEYNSDFNAAFYIYDTASGNLTYNLTNLPVFTDETRFTVDNQERLFLVDRYDNSLINCFCKGDVSTFNMNATVKQIMSLDGNHITVITTNGVYMIENFEVVRLSNTPPVVPCYYTGEGFVTDSIGSKFAYDKGKLVPVIPETTATEIAIDNSYTPIIKGNYIFTAQNTTVAKLYKSFGLSKADLTVYKTDGAVLSQGKLGTGMKALFGGNTYSIIIYGELTGEGNINSRDLKLMMKFLTNEEVPDSVQIISADIDGDGSITTKDLLSLSKMY